MAGSRLDAACINTIRFLAADSVQKALSGHPGMPMGAAAMAYVLWRRFLRHNPGDPDWANRDRFVLSAGHGSMLLYALLHLTGYDLPMAELKSFRQWGSRTPGHPESGLTPGVETTTGPLGQGFANAVGMALAERILRIGAHLLQLDEAEVMLRDGAVFGGEASVSVAEIARAAHIRQDLLPDGMLPTLEETGVYEPEITSGVFSYATHAAVVAVYPDTGEVEIRDYAVAEDCGTVVNPMIVDGQICGGVAQGVGTAMFEEIPFDDSGQPLATTFADYHLPGSTTLPRFRLAHMVTPAGRHSERDPRRPPLRRH